MKHLLLLWGALLFSVAVYLQMLFSGDPTMIMNSTKTLQGNLMPILDFRTGKANVFALKNAANLNLLLSRNRVTNLINKSKFSTYSKMLIVSGGYLYSEYCCLLDHAFEVYPHVESRWAESRGMNHEISAGLQSRYRLINTKYSLMFAVVGLFFEYEKWQHPAPDTNTPEHAYSRNIKTHLPFSYELQLTEKWTLTITGICRARPDSTFSKPRYGGAADLTYNITPTIGVIGTYRLIYDTGLIVSVRKDYNITEVVLNISL